MLVKLVPASLLHVGPIASKMRAVDRLECEAMGRSPKDALRIGLRASLSAFTAIEGAKPLAMMGVASANLISGRGLVWFLGREEVLNHGRALLTLGPRVLNGWLETFMVLENVVSADNDKAIKLLRKWGFAIGSESQMHGGVGFLPFAIRRPIQGPALAP